jgi:hypothetical protein
MSIDSLPYSISLKAAAAVTISPATGAAAKPPYPAFSIMTAKAILFFS